jgi:hypothetical protein
MGTRHERLTLIRTLLETMRTETERDFVRADRRPLDALREALDSAAHLAAALEFDPAVRIAPAVEPQTEKKETIRYGQSAAAPHPQP